MVVLGCQGGGNPASPPTDQSTNPGSSTNLTGQSDSGSPVINNRTGPNVLLWGLWDITIDPSTFAVTAVPLRGADFTFNVVDFLQPPDGKLSCLHVQVTDVSQFLDQGRLKADVTITHPFGDPRLVGFDTFGVFMNDAGAAFKAEPGAVYAPLNSSYAILENADGYTRWMNPVEFTQSGLSGYTVGALGTQKTYFTATLNPYKYFAQGIGSKSPLGIYLSDRQNLVNRGAFLPGTSLTREYDFKFPKVNGSYSTRFQYAVITHFQTAKDSGGKVIPSPKLMDFPPSANVQEAAYTDISTAGSTLYYKSPTDWGGNLNLGLGVVDWEGYVNPNKVLGEIDHIVVESNDELFDGKSIVFSHDDLANALISSKTVWANFALTIKGCTLNKNGPHDIMLAVYSANPTGYGPNFGAPYPVTAKLAAFFRGSVDVPVNSINLPPVIDHLYGQTAVNCSFGVEQYVVIAYGPEPTDTLTYAWDAVHDGDPPKFSPPLSTNNACDIDWSDGVKYPLGNYDVWVRVNDGINAPVFGQLEVTKSEADLVAGMIQANVADVSNVGCDITGNYTASASDCNPSYSLEYRFITKPTTDNTPPLSGDPDWTTWSSDSKWAHSWNDTVSGDWRMWADVHEAGNPSVEAVSPALAITRAQMIPVVPTPSGPADVDCSDIAAYAENVQDCDGGETLLERRYLSTSPFAPAGDSWVDFTGSQFILDYVPYPVGYYYLFVQANDGNGWVLCDTPLTVHRLKHAPCTPRDSLGRAECRLLLAPDLSGRTSLGLRSRPDPYQGLCRG